MNALTVIENEIANVLQSIDGTVQYSGYQFKTSTGQIEIEDEVIASAVNRSLNEYSHVDYTIEQATGETNLEWGDGANVYTNSVNYIITADVKNIGKPRFPKREIKHRCNDVLGDLKFAFANNHTLCGNVNWIRYNTSERQYTIDEDVIRTANLLVAFEVNYSQSFTNPDLLMNN